MGGACSGTKPQAKKQKLQQQELNIVDQPYLEVKSIPQSQSSSRPPEQRSETGQSVKDLLILYKKFTDFLGLVGNLDHLPQHTREQLNNCIIQRSNINILIQNSIKRIMREQQIIKRVEESDYYLIHNDEKFAITFTQIMQKISTIILTELKDDQDFQEAFPMLIVSFVDLAQQISNVIENFQNFKTLSSKKYITKQSFSQESNYQKTTHKISLQQ
ncbi:unnamed protein product (macronuclear) [Paramecium tetraurelia]|uniref:Uncharacterized protein n=1 Tax=Paramecium tetraurelia TaxID=5888 RepID=A0E0T4_PARTE|nr:uncharacterized protein GSPATT00022069001 [Paramecium tetraurelia]CAK88901.1 unnamed protein product [Paramecium tetraurelia]|eukprot:XP_001456298.1 hypothetical protein (macronuclear) [Paramecium tetraurelia strain d4-2]